MPESVTLTCAKVRCGRLRVNVANHSARQLPYAIRPENERVELSSCNLRFNPPLQCVGGFTRLTCICCRITPRQGNTFAQIRAISAILFSKDAGYRAMCPASTNTLQGRVYYGLGCYGSIRQTSVRVCRVSCADVRVRQDRRAVRGCSLPSIRRYLRRASPVRHDRHCG